MSVPSEGQRFVQEIQTLNRLRLQPELIQQASRNDVPELTLQKQLRAEYDSQLVRAAITLADLRRRAGSKFSRAPEMWFDRKGLEQATPELVAAYKARRFGQQCKQVVDLCCGIGADSVALARQGLAVTSVDLSPVACLFTELNGEVYGIRENLETFVNDVRKFDLKDQFIHFDPDRRTNQQRAVRLEDYSPSLEFLQQVTQSSKAGAVKLSPASNFGGKFPGCEIELISLNGECKEATVWFGELASPEPSRATILPGDFTIAADPADHYPEIGELGEFLYDPDPAIVRSGLVDALAEKLNLLRLDDAEEYLTSDSLVSSPAITPFRVLAKLPNNPKAIGKYLRSGPCGDLEIKCRHVPVKVEQLRKQLPILGSGRKSLIIARLAGKTHAVIAERVATTTN